MDKVLEDFAANARGLDRIYETSIERARDALFAVARVDGVSKLVAIAGEPEALGLQGEPGPAVARDGRTLASLVCPCDVHNARRLQALLPWANPVALGTRGAFGAGDRLGCATPGHVRAVRRFRVAPVFAQQSIREMSRTRRSPDDVVASAVFGILQEGYRGPWGADADHLKTIEDVKLTSAAGFTMFTFDPSDHVRAEAFGMSSAALDAEFAGVEGAREIIRRWVGKSLAVETPEGTVELALDELQLKRCIVGYAKALREVKRMYEALSAETGGRELDVEVSFDETDEPTPPATHFFLAAELAEAGVKFESLALRFVGEFQKGIDYRGDVEQFRRQFRVHAAVARRMGPYKLSIHSGSDKFTVYPIIGEESGGLLHVKTAGTSYLEAIRVVARNDPELYRAIHRLALRRFEADRASYHVSTDLSKVAPLEETPDAQLDQYLVADDSRQLVHITYGSVLADGTLRERLFACLNKYSEDHFNTVAGHISKHLELVGFEAAS